MVSDRYDLIPAQSNHPQGIRCRRCRMVSYHPQDVLNRYCGYCHVYHEDLPASPLSAAPTASSTFTLQPPWAPVSIESLSALMKHKTPRPETPPPAAELGLAGSLMDGNLCGVKIHVLPPGGFLDMGGGNFVLTQEAYDQLRKEIG